MMMVMMMMIMIMTRVHAVATRAIDMESPGRANGHVVLHAVTPIAIPTPPIVVRHRARRLRATGPRRSVGVRFNHRDTTGDAQRRRAANVLRDGVPVMI